MRCRPYSAQEIEEARAICERDNIVRWAMQDPRFEFEKVPCYDGEGIEGWRFRYKDHESTALGEWDGTASVTDEAFDIIQDVLCEDAANGIIHTPKDDR